MKELCPSLKLMKVFLPGARCDKILAEIVRLSARYSFENIILHVGGNYIPHVYSDSITSEVVSFIETVNQLLPETKIAFSEILPKIDTSLLYGINNINKFVYEFCQCNSMDFVRHRFFNKRRDGSIDGSLLCWDGTHLSYKGVDTMEKDLMEDLMEYLLYYNKY